MAIEITDGAVTLISDFPYQVGYAGASGYDRAAETKASRIPTLALITHRHLDHWEPRIFAGTNWKVFGPSDVTSGVPADRVLPARARVTFGPVQIEPIETPHHNIGHYSYIVTWHGKRLYFSGDTESTDSLREAKNIDVAFVSPWMHRWMYRRGHRADARRIVIYHHEPGQQVEGCEAKCSVPRPGDRIALE